MSKATTTTTKANGLAISRIAKQFSVLDAVKPREVQKKVEPGTIAGVPALGNMGSEMVKETDYVTNGEENTPYLIAVINPYCLAYVRPTEGMEASRDNDNPRIGLHVYRVMTDKPVDLDELQLSNDPFGVTGVIDRSAAYISIDRYSNQSLHWRDDSVRRNINQDDSIENSLELIKLAVYHCPGFAEWCEATIPQSTRPSFATERAQRNSPKEQGQTVDYGMS